MSSSPSTTVETRVEARGLARSFPTRTGELGVLRDASLTLRPGESLAVMGPSGSGKSTLLNLLGTLDRPTRGTLRIGGVDPFELDERALAHFRGETIGFVFQDHLLLPQCTLLENVLLPTLARTGRPDRSPRALELLRRVGLADRHEHRPAELSGGERQRAAVARALINAPRLLLADEPTGNLDRRAADAVADLLLELQRAQQFALVVVTHSEAIAARFGERRTMVDGVLAQAAGATRVEGGCGGG